MEERTIRLVNRIQIFVYQIQKLPINNEGNSVKRVSRETHPNPAPNAVL